MALVIALRIARGGVLHRVGRYSTSMTVCSRPASKPVEVMNVDEEEPDQPWCRECDGYTTREQKQERLRRKAKRETPPEKLPPHDALVVSEVARALKLAFPEQERWEPLLHAVEKAFSRPDPEVQKEGAA